MVSLLDSDAELKVGLNLSTFSPREIVELGWLADELGYSSVWIPDHLADLPPSGDKVDPWSLLGAIAANSEKIRLFAGVTDPLRIHPAKIANVVATLDDLSGGRADLAIGAGEGMNLTRFGIPWDSNPDERRKRLREAILVIRGLLASSLGRPFSFQGKYHTISGARIDQKPLHDIKVYVGALGGRKTLEMIGEIGDGWYPAANTIETFERGCRLIEESAKLHNREANDIERVHCAFTILTKNDPEREKKCLEAFRYLLFTLMSKPIVKEMRNRGLLTKSEEENYVELSYQHIDPTEAGVRKAFSIAKNAPLDLVSEYAIVGRNPNEVREKLEPFVKAGSKHIVLTDVNSIMVTARSGDCADFLREMSGLFSS